MKIKKRKDVISIIIWLIPLLVIGTFVGWVVIHNQQQAKYFVIGAPNKDSYIKIAQEFQRVDSIKVYQKSEQLWQALIKGWVDVIIADHLQGLAMMNTDNCRRLKLAGPLLSEDTRVVGFRPEDDALRQAINRGLAEVVSNKIYDSIYQRYFGETIINVSKLKNVNVEVRKAIDSSWNRVYKADRLVVAMNSDDPPFSYFDKQHQLVGFDLELAWAICIQLGIKNFQPVVMKKSQLIQELRSHRYDLIWGISITEPLRSKLDFSNPYCYTGAQLFIKKGSKITGPEFLVPPVFPERPPENVHQIQ